MYKKFLSVAKVTDGNGGRMDYCYDSQQYGGNAPIHSYFRQFYTYGDGLTAHSNDWPIQKEYVADYLASLAVAMLADPELSNELAYTFSRRPRLEQIEFAAGVVYKAPKNPHDVFISRKWFSASEMKISSSSAKEHDKRYQEIRENVHDGSPKSIFRILIREYADGLEKYLYADAIRDWAIQQDGLWMEMAAEFVGWSKDRDETHAIQCAMDACRNITEGRRLLHAAESAIENYKRRVAPKEPPKPEPEEVRELAEHVQEQKAAQ